MMTRKATRVAHEFPVDSHLSHAARIDSETGARLKYPHRVNGRSLTVPFPEFTEVIVFGMGNFWGAERTFWQLEGVHVTAVGYAGGRTVRPKREEVLTGRTGHAEVVLVVFEPRKLPLAELLRQFWLGHDPTQTDRQGYDQGSQYRSAVFCFDRAQQRAAWASRDSYQRALTWARHGTIATRVEMLDRFYYAEPGHQQFLARVPDSFDGADAGLYQPVGTGIPWPGKR